MAISRRSFLYGLGASTIGASTLLPGIGWAASSSNSSGQGSYKALVCVCLLGGNDGFNMLIPSDDTHYNEYKSARKTIAIKQEQLLKTDIVSTDNEGNAVEIGLHPSMGGLQSLCEKGYVNTVLNCGVLRQPMTKEQTQFAPGMLFSHNSQREEWFKGNANSTENTGWAGRLMTQLNGAESSSILPPLFSFDGATKLFNGEVKSSAFKNNKVSALEYASDEVQQTAEAFNQEETEPKSQFHQLFHNIINDSVNYSNRASKVFALPNDAKLYNSGNGLALQFNSVLKFIKARETLGQDRQIFYVTLDGFDTHSNQSGTHSQLLKKLGDALNLFYQSLEEQGLEANVTTVTLSDFGRRIPPNASGTDHGWGNNQIVVNGGSLTPGATGTWPSLAYGSDDDYSTGRILPTTSVDQIGATLATWMGVSNGDISQVFPSLGHFYPQNLGFI